VPAPADSLPLWGMPALVVEPEEADRAWGYHDPVLMRDAEALGAAALPVTSITDWPPRVPNRWGEPSDS